MNNVVEFIVRLGELGANPSKIELTSLVEELQISEIELNTIMLDKKELAKLLDARENVFAILLPAEDDESGDESDDSEEEIIAA
ncbi:MAG: hypothetical protein HWE16_11655 [Gammaproteobacteria bacterium]|nr:hypothetical protein [Gammaproteobacteria bacterium]